MPDSNGTDGTNAASTSSAAAGMTAREAMAFAMASMVQNQVAHYNRMNAYSEAAFAAFIKNADKMTPEQVLEAIKMTSGGDFSEQMTQMANAMSKVQETMDGSRTTPPSGDE